MKRLQLLLCKGIEACSRTENDCCTCISTGAQLMYRRYGCLSSWVQMRRCIVIARAYTPNGCLSSWVGVQIQAWVLGMHVVALYV